MSSIVKIANLFEKQGNKIIITFFLINLLVFVAMVIMNIIAKNTFNPRNDKVNSVSASMQWDNKQISKLKKLRRWMIISYTFYANITSIFPLLGILGTVASLITYSDETMMDNFMVALSTTLLGVMFAIFFKFIDAFVSGPMDVFIEDADYVIQEYESEKRHGNEA